MHIETVSFSATAPGAAGAAASAFAGDTLNIRNGKPGSAIRALAFWATLQTAGFVQFTQPSGHDTTRGFRSRHAAGVNLALPVGAPLPFQPQETISPVIAGSATAGDVEQASMLMMYEDLPGIDTSRRLKRWDEVQKRIVRMLTVEATIAGAAGPSYGVGELINAESNLLRAYTNYAVLGITFGVQCHMGWIQGPDTGGQRVSVPGIASKPEVTAQWFPMLSRAYDLPLIPIISSGNKDSTTIGIAQDENVAAIPLSIHLGLIDGEI